MKAYLMRWNKGKILLKKSASCLRLMRYLYKNYRILKNLLGGIEQQPQVAQGTTIVINAVRGMSVNYKIELFIAYQLALRGAEVKLFVDDGVMAHWDLDQYQNIEKNCSYDPYDRLSENKKTLQSIASKAKMRLLYFLQKKVFELAHSHKNLKIIYYSRFINDNIDDVQASEYDRNQAYSSTKRFFENGLVDLQNKEHKKYFQKSLKNSLLSKKIGRKILKHIKPDLFLTSHGIYSTWGPCYHVIKQAGIKTLIWELHFCKSKKMIFVDDIIQLISNDSDWQQKKEKELDSSSLQLLDEEFSARLNHHSLDTNTYFNGRIKGAQTNGSFDYLKSKPLVFGMFPNVYWDGNIAERNKAFDDLIEWMEFTIEKIRKTNNTLVIRFHPSEATFQKGCKQLEKILTERNSELKNYDNIKLISSDAKVDTYSFARKYVDIGLLYSGTLALELTYMDIPVISCSKSFYNNVGFCFEPETKQEYEDMLLKGDMVLKTFSEKKNQFKDKLQKFSHWYFHEIAYELPIMDAKRIYGFCYEELMPKDVDPQKNKELSKSIDKILQSLPQ